MLAALTTTGASLVANYNWAFMVGQSLMPGFNALLLGTLLYRSGLVPRALPTLGLIGAPILITATVLTIFGVVEQYSPLGGLAALPIVVWEFSLGLYLTFKGFKATAPIMVAAAAETGSLDGPATAVRPPTAVTTSRCSMTADREQTRPDLSAAVRPHRLGAAPRALSVQRGADRPLATEGRRASSG